MKTLNDHTGPVRTIIYAPDGKSFATASFDGTVRFWDAATAKLQKTLNAHNTGVQCLAFSPNGKYLATTARPTGGAADSEIALWDLTSDKEPARFTGNRGHILSLDFSPDGKMLASGGGSFSQFGEVKLFEVASRLERAKLKDHKEWVECVKFSPDGRLLASAGGFTRGVAGQIDIQRLTELLEKKRSTTADLTADQLKVLWDTLGDADAAKAYQAILALSGAGKQVVPYLRNRLKDVPKEKPKTVDAVRIAQWIAELDDDNPDVRDKASEELKRAGTAAQPYLRKALEKVSSAEVRIRLEVLLNKAPGVPSQTLRVIRVLEALEHNATPEARELLAKLAGEELKGDLREQAKASLTRLSTVQK
jgi:dipeptidyl aminopeptidase/acylaminoacyl peptidase